MCVCVCVCACVRACVFQHPFVPICTEQLPTGCSWGLNASLTHNLPPPPPPPPPPTSSPSPPPPFLPLIFRPYPPISPACSPSISLCHYFILSPAPTLSFVSTFMYFKVTVRKLPCSTTFAHMSESMWPACRGSTAGLYMQGRYFYFTCELAL